jgi:predicted secreted protein
MGAVMALNLATAVGAAPLHAHEAAPQGVVVLSATASTEVTKDWLSVVLSTTREGSDAGQVQTALKQALDAALKEARPAAKPGQVELQTGNFSIYPRYNTKGVISGWRGSAEMVLEGRDAVVIGQLTGRINTLSISRVSWGLSREEREKVEGAVSADAVARFRSKAQQMVNNFGYGSYTVREVNVSSNDIVSPPPMFAMRAMAAPSPEGEPLPTEAGKATVTVTVSGSIQLAR